MTKQVLQLKKKILPILKKHDVIQAGIFGSYSKGEQTKKSDIDLLIKFKGRKSLLDLIRLENDLEDNLNKKFDVITYKGINHLLRKKILSEEQRILCKRKPTKIQ